eukprot:5109826-Pleurochrysis_carterae.AAC.1
MECAGACTLHTTHSAAMSLGACSRRTTSVRGSALSVTCVRVGEDGHVFECAAGREGRTIGVTRWKRLKKAV